MIVLVQILLAHLIGDFFLQSGAAVKQKEAKKWRAPFLYLHVTLHFALILLITWNLSLWLAALMISAIHLIIDGLKLQFQKDGNRTFWFFGDQILHLATLLAVWYFIIDPEPAIYNFFVPEYWYIITGGMLLTMPAAIAIAIVLDPMAIRSGDQAIRSLHQAGRYMGILERLLIFMLIISGLWMIVLLLLVAKFVYLFAYLPRDKSISLNTYPVWGSVLSTGLAISVGLIVQNLI